jgi:hypothetical protein
VKWLLLVALTSVLLLAACGGSSTTPPETGPSPAFTKQTITNDWESFFSPKTTVSGKDALLQDGKKFEPVVRSFESNPAAKSVSVVVKSVTLQGANKAKVVYVVKLAGASLPQQTGYSVKQNGRWEIEDQSLCSLIELGGTAPPQCTK